ncbi:hypothetical protein HanIR_Chr14g0713091 [Helianthus annuus]|nr:hypothetical protein HanIR_Chr14g0713091 [Helianthus annuus]
MEPCPPDTGCAQDWNLCRRKDNIKGQNRQPTRGRAKATRGMVNSKICIICDSRASKLATGRAVDTRGRVSTRLYTAVNEERGEKWPRGRARWARAVVNVYLQPINRGACFHSNPPLANHSLSLTTIPPPLQHQHPPPSSIFHHLECVVVSGSKIDHKSRCQTKAMFG